MGNKLATETNTATSTSNSTLDTSGIESNSEPDKKGRLLHGLVELFQAPDELVEDPKESKAARSKCALHLSTNQIVQVRKMWEGARAAGDNEPGLAIFKQVFYLSSEIKEIFGFYDGRDNKRLNGHAKVFTDRLDFLINNLEHDYVVSPTLIQMGRRHAYMRNVGFKVYDWDVFGRAILQCSQNWVPDKTRRSLETQKAWTDIVIYLIDKMKEGYYAENRKLRKLQFTNTVLSQDETRSISSKSEEVQPEALEP